MKDLDRLLKEIFQDKSAILAHLTIELGSVICQLPCSKSAAQVSHRACKDEDNIHELGLVCVLSHIGQCSNLGTEHFHTRLNTPLLEQQLPMRSTY